MSEDQKNDEQQADDAAATATTQEQQAETPADAEQDTSADDQQAEAATVPATETPDEVPVQVVDLPDAPIALLFDCGGGKLINLTQITYLEVADPEHNDLVYVVGAAKGIPIAKDRTTVLRQICPTVEGRI